MRTLRSHPADDPKAVSLLMTVEIHCEVCGVSSFVVPGHHLKAVIAGLQKGLETYPELCKEHVTEIPQGVNFIPGGEGKPS